jgi:hypothetical protein
MPKLNQVIAVEKGVKSRVYGEVSELHKASQKPDLFSGFVKTYRKKDEEGEDYPPEQKKVQMTVGDALGRISKGLTEMFDVTAAKDWANCTAAADVKVDGVGTILEHVPVPYLLFLEKQLTDLHTFIDKLPVLDEADEWLADENTGLFKTKATATHRTKKIQKPIVLYDATKEHPAQTQILTEDVVVGYWDTVKHSGALPAPRKRQLLERVEKLAVAVKFAREEANSAEAPAVNVGSVIFGYLLA